MRDIHVSAIADAVKKLCMEANWNLEPDMLRAFDTALGRERSEAGKQVKADIEETLANLAKRFHGEAQADEQAAPEEYPPSEGGSPERGESDEPPPEEGQPIEETLAFVREHILPFPMGNSHPRFFGFINATAAHSSADS